MSFFDYQPARGAGKEDYTVSNKFWVYWALAIPLSFIMLLIWLFWEKRITKRLRSGAQSQFPQA